MIYHLDYNKIGSRIRDERITAGCKTQSEFALKMGLSEDSRQSVGKWENGVCLPSFEIILEMCKLFDCEIDYLLCQSGYTGKTKKATDVQNATGLSERAIQKLFTFRKRKKGTNSFSNFDFHINAIIEHDSFADLVSAIKKHVWGFNHGHYNIVDANSEAAIALAETFNCEPNDLKDNIKMASIELIESTLMKIVEDIRLDEIDGKNSKKKKTVSAPKPPDYKKP